MGWFDDNHPMGAEADALMDDALGLNKWFKDPQPAASSSTRTFQRIERPEAEWDSTKWRKSNLRESDTMPKTKAKTQYLLTDKDMLPLEYRKEFNDAGYKCVKAYRKRDVERTSWEKHGGPNGLKAAKLDQKNGVVRPKAVPQTSKSTPTGKTKSSTSVAARKGTLPTKGKGKASTGDGAELGVDE